uniref:Uncharacterized protein n=1 Tax=Siphoviridae sp. ctdHi7 TaxID=2825577 RepID=A0A8S5U1S8_9CAUD|nr:MAG TPA: hypothetical protein [Siphoviridae sp. ctdHi7]
MRPEEFEAMSARKRAFYIASEIKAAEDSRGK